MKSILIVVVMLLNSQQDLYIIQKPSFGSVVPINNNTLIKVSSSEFGDVEAKFK